MKRLLLLAPVMALLLMACPNKHATTAGSPPPAPDPNAYSTGSETVQGSYGAVEEEAPVGSGSGSSTTTTTTTTATTTTSDTVVTTVVMPNAVDSSKLSRLVVSFISKGEGVDETAHQNLDKWLQKHPDVRYKVNHWGREGEMDYVFLIESQTTVRQNQVVQDVRNLIGTNDRVLILEWAEAHQPRGEVPPIAAEPVDSNVVRLVVSFISKGEGIDYKTEERFKAWLAERPQFTYEVTHWGREGETNYCFRMSNIDGRQQEAFVRDVRTFLTDKELVIVSEWAKCDKRK